MQFAAFVQQGANGKPYMGIQVQDGEVTLQVALATADNVDDVIKNIVTGLKEAAVDLKRQASGLVVANGLEVPDGFRRIQGRPAQRTGGKG